MARGQESKPHSDPLVRQYEISTLGALKSPRKLVREVLAGLVVALALIPEAISFSIIAGVDPAVGLFSSFIMAVVIAIAGGRTAMISAATGAVALVIAPLMRDYGFDYFVACVLLAGVLQVVFALLGVSKLIRFVPRAVMVGFVNALAILVFMAQMPQLIDVPWVVYPLLAAGIVILWLFPKITGAVPPPLVAVVVITAVVMIFDIKVPTVGDQGELPHGLPQLFFPNVPLTWETLQIIAPYAAAMALVGLMESLLTAQLVDNITGTSSNKKRESWGQGLANITSGFFGGMGGCAMIGQTMINVKISGARTRISTFCAGAFLLVLVLVFDQWVAQIPMAALVAVMIMVCVSTFDWHSIHPRTLHTLPKSETAIMVVTVATVLLTSNLAIGVIVGVLTAAVVFVRQVAHVVRVDRELQDDDGNVLSADTPADEVARAVYRVRGALFFGSSNDFTTMFRYGEDPDVVSLDLSQAQVWDASSVAALDSVEATYAEQGKRLVLEGMSEKSRRVHGSLSGELGGN